MPLVSFPQTNQYNVLSNQESGLRLEVPQIDLVLNSSRLSSKLQINVLVSPISILLQPENGERTSLCNFELSSKKPQGEPTFSYLWGP